MIFSSIRFCQPQYLNFTYAYSLFLIAARGKLPSLLQRNIDIWCCDVGNGGLRVSETSFPPSRLFLWWTFFVTFFCVIPNIPRVLHFCVQWIILHVAQKLHHECSCTVPVPDVSLWQCAGTPLPWPLPLQTTSLASAGHGVSKISSCIYETQLYISWHSFYVKNRDLKTHP